MISCGDRYLLHLTIVWQCNIYIYTHFLTASHLICLRRLQLLFNCTINLHPHDHNSPTLIHYNHLQTPGGDGGSGYVRKNRKRRISRRISRKIPSSVTDNSAKIAAAYAGLDLDVPAAALNKTSTPVKPSNTDSTVPGTIQ